MTPAEASTALITNDTVVLGLLAATLAFVFWGASRTGGPWKKFYAIVPALLIKTSTLRVSLKIVAKLSRTWR